MPRFMRVVLAHLLLTTVAAPSWASAQGRTPGERLPVLEHTLDNGLKLLILPRRGAPTVSFVVRYDVGGVHEHLGTTGIAHLLEHLLFKGTTSVGTHDVRAERRLFDRMDAIHDTLIRARAEQDSARVDQLWSPTSSIVSSPGPERGD